MSRLDIDHPAINVTSSDTLLRYSASITTHFLPGNRLLSDITYHNHFLPKEMPVTKSFAL